MVFDTLTGQIPRDYPIGLIDGNGNFGLFSEGDKFVFISGPCGKRQTIATLGGWLTYFGYVELAHYYETGRLRLWEITPSRTWPVLH